MWRIVLVGFAMMMSGCSLLKPVETPVISRYALDRASHNTVRRAPSQKSILIMLPVANPGYQSSNMIYLKDPYKLQAFAQNAWVASPAQMIQPLLAESLRNAGLFHAVLSAPFAGVTDYRLETTLVKLQQEFDDQHSVLRLWMEADFINNLNNTVIASKRFEMLAPVPEANPYSGVITANQLTEKMMRAMVNFIDSAMNTTKAV